MSWSKIITIIGIGLLFFYSLIQILSYYGVSSEVYDIYIVFYIFILLSILILPNKEET